MVVIQNLFANCFVTTTVFALVKYKVAPSLLIGIVKNISRYDDDMILDKLKCRGA